MQITPKEIEHVAAAETARFDMYSGIHKALRAFMADTLLAVGRMDPRDDAEVAQGATQVLQLLAFCRSHLAHENAFVHPAMDARAPGASDAVAHEHEEHLRELARLEETVEALRATPAAQRDACALGLYRALALFVAGNFDHMHVEETAHNTVLWSRYSDAELAGLHDTLVASIPPQEMMQVARWMVPFMNPAERLALLADMRAKAPPPAFAAVLETVRLHLSAQDWGKLTRGLGVPAARGLVAG